MRNVFVSTAILYHKDILTGNHIEVVPSIGANSYVTTQSYDFLVTIANYCCPVNFSKTQFMHPHPRFYGVADVLFEK